MTRAVAALVLLVACARSASRTGPTAPIPGSAPAVVAAPPAVPAFFAPTLDAAGAKECRLEAVVELGPIVGDPPVLGFGARGGLAAWLSAETTLALRPLDASGATRAPATTVAVGTGYAPRLVYAVDRGFLVLLRLWDLRQGPVRWRGLLVAPDGSVLGSAVDLGLDGMDVLVGRALDGAAVGLILAPAFTEAPWRWQTIAVDADGHLASTPIEVAVDDLGNTGQDRWVPAELDGRPGWVILRAGARRPDGVFAGARLPAGRAVLLGDDLSGAVVNLATPPPPGPGGTIYEAMAEPALVREHHGRRLGDATRLVVRGDAVGVTGMYLEIELAWTGSRFACTYIDEQTARLLPVNCR
jgi:hypothetical protein